MRKKWITRMLTALVVLTLSACGNADSEHAPEQVRDNSSTEKQVSQGTPESTGDNTAGGLTSLIHHTGIFTRYCSTEAGFYYLTEEASELADGSYAPHLMYMDYATCQEVYLCSDSSCRHDTEDCTSVLAGASSDGRIFIWDGYLYFLDRPLASRGTVIFNAIGESDGGTEADQAELYRMDLDGTGRERIYSFEADATVEDIAFGGKDGLYFITKKLGASKSSSGTYTTTSDRQLICLDPDTGKAHAVCSLDFGDGLNWEAVGCSEDQVILKAYRYPDGMTDEDVSGLDEGSYLDILRDTQIVYTALNLSTGENTQLYSQPAGDNSASEAVLGGFLYTSSSASQDIAKVDLSTGEVSTLCSMSTNYIYGTLGNLLCCTSQDMTADYGYYLADTETGKVTYCSLTNKALGWQLEFLATTGDRVLTVYDYEYTDLGNNSYDITRYQYGLITMEDLMNSVADYKPIQMTGKGI